MHGNAIYEKDKFGKRFVKMCIVIWPKGRMYMNVSPTLQPTSFILYIFVTFLDG